MKIVRKAILVILAVFIFENLLLAENEKEVKPRYLQYNQFSSTDYPSTEYRTSKQIFLQGDAVITIIQVKRIAGYPGSPLCRAWIYIEKANKILWSAYFNDFEPVGGSFGIFVPSKQPSTKFLTILKAGDYDGRTFIINIEGKVYDLLGGWYFLSDDRRYLFSEYLSDSSGLSVFDFINEKEIFRSDNLPPIHEWYKKDGQYFFTERYWRKHPAERTDVIYMFDFESNRIIEEKSNAKILAEYDKVSFDFDPNNYPDCGCIKK